MMKMEIFKELNMKNFYLKIINQLQLLKRLKKGELQKNLFDYIGAGTVSPKF